MTRRRLLWAWLVAGALGMTVVWLTCFRPQQDFFTWEKYQQVRGGMTLEEVEAVVGAKPGDYGPEQLQGWSLEYLAMDFLTNPHRRGTSGMHWSGDTMTLFVEFDFDGKACLKYVRPANRTTPNMLDRLRTWLGW